MKTSKSKIYSKVLMIIFFSMPLFSLQIRVSVRWQPFLTVFTRHPSPRMISGCCPTVSEIEFFRAVRPSADHSASSSSESFVRWNIRSRIRPSPQPAMTHSTHQQWGVVRALTPARNAQITAYVIHSRMSRRFLRAAFASIFRVVSIAFGFCWYYKYKLLNFINQIKCLKN